MAEPQESLKTSIFVLPDGPNSEPKYLACAGIDSVTVPLGNNTLEFCKNPRQAGRYDVVAKIKGPPGLVTFSIQQLVRAAKNYLLGNCPMPIVVNAFNAKAPNDFINWDLSFVYPGADVVQRTRSNFVSRGDANALSLAGFDMEADEEVELQPLKTFRDNGVTETTALNALFTCAAEICGSESNPRQAKCDVFYAVADAVVGSAAGTADVWKYDKGTWTVAAADPFATGENISAGACFSVGRDVTRILVFRGSTDAGNPAECAYSDDAGATWTTVNIGSTNAEFVPSAHSLAALDRSNIWVGTDLGRIYFSGDGGATWTVQENAAIHAAAWNWVEFIDENNGFAGGAADVLAATVDGGTTWTQVTASGNGGDILCGTVLDPQRVWVGTDDGEIFYTLDGGTIWTERAGWSGSGTGDVKVIRFANEMVGFMLHNTATPKGNFFMTRDGGYTWEQVTTPTNTGLNDLLLCGTQLLFAAGEVQGSTAALYKLQPATA